MSAYDFLDDPAEREWLTNLAPADVVANAHRFYDFMREQGMAADSFTRELAFKKASEALGRDYEEFDQAWVDERRMIALSNIPSTLKHLDGSPCQGAQCFKVLWDEHRWLGDVILRVDESRYDRGWRTMIVTANEEGYDQGPTLLNIIERDQFALARAYVEQYNAARGYTPAEALDIVSSSMFGKHYTRFTTGYVCKRCLGPSPVGVGYTDLTAARMGDLPSCACGYSVKPTSTQEQQ